MFISLYIDLFYSVLRNTVELWCCCMLFCIQNSYFIYIQRFKITGNCICWLFVTWRMNCYDTLTSHRIFQAILQFYYTLFRINFIEVKCLWSLVNVSFIYFFFLIFTWVLAYSTVSYSTRIHLVFQLIKFAMNSSDLVQQKHWTILGLQERAILNSTESIC